MDFVMESAPGARTIINGRWRDYFAGTGYLGLQGHSGLVAAAGAALNKYGLTTATSRGGYGEHPVLQAVERAAAVFLSQEAALYTVSAYLGSEILLQGLQNEYDRIYVDEVAHLSGRDAASAAGVPVHPFPHANPAALAGALHTTLGRAERPLVLTDGVFPISGEVAPLMDYIQVLSRYEGAILCIDDAHATGVIGSLGRGSLEFASERCGTQGVSAGSDTAVRCYTTHTLSKALGGHGGVIAGSSSFIEQLWRNAHALVGSSPSPLPAAAASTWSLDYVRSHPELREQLWSNVARARSGLRRLGWVLEDSPVPILCLTAFPGVDLAHLKAELFERDICVAHVTRYSSTPQGGALRVAIFATHTDEQIDRLIAEIEKLR